VFLSFVDWLARGSYSFSTAKQKTDVLDREFWMHAFRHRAMVG